jgi:hypothetical protein
VCDKNLNIVSMGAASPVVHTSNLSCYKKNLFRFPVAVNNSIKVCPLVFLFYIYIFIFVITENIMKRPVYVMKNRGIIKNTLQGHCDINSVTTFYASLSS